MALYKYVLHEAQEPDADGNRWMQIGPETEEERCYLCGEEAHANWCPGDGRSHHHGCVHTPEGGLEAVCRSCHPKVEQAWLEANRGWAAREAAKQ